MPDPKLGDVVKFASDEDMVIATVVELGEPEHHEVLVQDQETGHRKWILNVDVEVIDPAQPPMRDYAGDRNPLRCNNNPTS